MADGAWAGEVLAFWFDEVGKEGWYSETPAAIDAAVRERFLPLYETVSTKVPEAAGRQGRSALAAILVLDQFPRHMFRGQARAFATDAVAASLSRNAVDADLHAAMPPERKQFLFMPLMHSELLADQERCVALFTATPGLEDSVRYAVEHRDIVAEFGRLPHRNRALGRQTTPAEAAFLRKHAGFGQ